MDYAAAVNEEIRDLFAAGADIVQIDEPYMQARPEKAREYGLKALNRALDGISGTTAVHICFGYAAIIHQRPVGLLVPAGARRPARARQISIETAQSKLDCAVLARLDGQEDHGRAASTSRIMNVETPESRRRAHPARASLRAQGRRDPRARLRHEVLAARGRVRQDARDGRGREAAPRGVRVLDRFGAAPLPRARRKQAGGRGGADKGDQPMAARKKARRTTHRSVSGKSCTRSATRRAASRTSRPTSVRTAPISPPARGRTQGREEARHGEEARSQEEALGRRGRSGSADHGSMPTLLARHAELAYTDEGAGPPVILVHGSASTRGQWRAAVLDFVPQFRVLAPDLHGYGATPLPPALESLTFDDEAELVDALAHLVGQDVHLVGHSYGGGSACALRVCGPSASRA